jgi:hypothetical protein
MERNDARFVASGYLGRVLLGSYFPLVRMRLEGRENLQRLRDAGQPVIFAFWHGQLLPLVHVHRNEGIVVLVSEHADGEYITQVILRHGFRTARGSSTRGGVKGLKGVVRAGREGHDLGFTPDGPRGPRHVFKWGALVAAQLTGHPVIPLTVGADRAWYLDSWDRFMIPKPFSTMTVRYGTPRTISRHATKQDLREAAEDLQDELRATTLELNPGERDTDGEEEHR